MSDIHSDNTALRREWRAAIFVVGGGFAIAILVAIYFAFFASPPTPAIAPDESTPVTQVQENQEENAVAAQQQVCHLELANAQNFGLIPSFGKLADPNPRATSVKGRYACTAGTPASKYELTGDLVCRNLNDAHCVVLYSVTSDDGTVLFKRQQ
ncbi:MAG TPA: hypothetical protein VHW02_14950 [Rhizomicrobium sp.]|jgi:hypothetical protein|nr:hypothetical protein [Rhizomicrobium sp.]